MRRYGITSASELFVLPAREGLDFPLATETMIELFTPMARQEFDFIEKAIARHPRRRPWQQIVSAEVSRNRVSLVVERFFGVNAAALLARLQRDRRVLSLEAWLALFDQLLEAIEPFPLLPEWHLSPSSIGWSLTGTIMLSLHEVGSVLDRLVMRHGALGPKFAFLSPETLHSRPLLAQSAVFVGAAVGYALLTTQPPFRGHSDFSIFEALRQGRFAAVEHPEATPAVERFFARAFAQAPADRFSSIGELRAALSTLGTPRPRAAAFGELAAACWPSFREVFAELRREPELLPSAWEGLWTRGAPPLEALAVWEDHLLELTGQR